MFILVSNSLLLLYFYYQEVEVALLSLGLPKNYKKTSLAHCTGLEAIKA
jgi:hypothetical protein